MDLFQLALGERGAHARAVYGVGSLSFDAPIELVVTAEIRLQVSSGMKQDYRQSAARVMLD